MGIVSIGKQACAGRKTDRSDDQNKTKPERPIQRANYASLPRRQPIAGNGGKPLLADTSRHPKRVRHPDIRGRSKFCTRHNAGASTIVSASRKRWQYFQLPDGQITRLFERGDFAVVQPRFQKYFYSPQGPITFTSDAVPSLRGAFRDRHKRGAGCGGRGCAFDEW